MHIALVSLHTSPTEVAGQGDAGGMNVVVREQALALSKLGHRVTIITRASATLSPGQHPLVTSEGSGAHSTETPHVYALNVGNINLLKNQLINHLSEFADEMVRLENSLQHPFDVVHSHYWISGLASEKFLRARESASPGGSTPMHAVTLHTVAAQKNLHLATGDNPEPQARLDGENLLVHSAQVIATSMSELHGIITGYSPSNVEAQRINATVINPGVDTALFNPRQFDGGFVDARLVDVGCGSAGGPSAGGPSTGGSSTGGSAAGESAARPLRISVLGRQQPLKGQDLAISAFAEFVTNYPELASGAKLIIAGAPTPGNEEYGEKLRQLANQISSEHNVSPENRAAVVFLPAQTRQQSATLLASSDIVLVPSHSETFGLVALEAAASGTPVIASNVTGLRESVNDASGILVDGRDPRLWADKIAELITNGEASSSNKDVLDRSKLETLGKSAREWALQHTWQMHTLKLERSYQNMIRQDPTRPDPTS